MTDLATRILSRIKRGRPGTVWVPADFVHLASRDLVDKTLQRLVLAGDLRRIDRGLYDRPTPIRLENLQIEFKKTPPSRLYWAGRPAMRRPGPSLAEGHV